MRIMKNPIIKKISILFISLAIIVLFIIYPRMCLAI